MYGVRGGAYSECEWVVKELGSESCWGAKAMRYEMAEKKLKTHRDKRKYVRVVVGVKA